MKFHPIKVLCPTCKNETTILGTSFSIQGVIHYALLCVVCGINLEMDMTWEDTVIYCAQQETIQKAIMPEVKTIQ